MSRRRGAGITGPQSALTSYLASHNIDAYQIQQDHRDRLAAAERSAALRSGNAEQDDVDQDEDEKDAAVEETEAQTKKRKRQEKQEQKAIEKIKKSKEFARKKAQLLGLGEPGGDDDDELALDIYSKAKLIPGQMENCEECSKRFTVTPYTKEGPDGGLLCTKCGKAQEDAKKKDAKVKKVSVSRGKKAKTQSNLMDGHGALGTKSLLETCLQSVAKSIDDIDDFGDLPPALYDRLSMLLSKHRVLNSKTLDLFLQSDNTKITAYDCAKIQTDDFIKIFQICPGITVLDLRRAGQFKDRVIDFILERKVPIRDLRLDAPNLITDQKWQEYFFQAGFRLESLQLSWLDFAFTNSSVASMVENCRNLKRLKLKYCFHFDDDTLTLLQELKGLEHLSLKSSLPTTSEPLEDLITSAGRNLESLCLRDFIHASDNLIKAILETCRRVKKLVITNNSTITDIAYETLFNTWTNPPLERIDLSGSRDMVEDSNHNHDDNETTHPAGLSSAGFSALMNHSGSALQKLKIVSCRGISKETLLDVFDGEKQYPYLAEIDMSFVSKADTAVVAGIFKSCPKLKKLVAFGCFDVVDVRIPIGVALIGVPSAENGIVQEGFEGFDRMEIDE